MVCRLTAIHRYPPSSKKLTSSSFSRDETTGSEGFKGDDFTGERSATLTKKLSVKQALR